MSSRRRAGINWVKHSMWLGRAGNVCGQKVYIASRLDAETYIVRLMHTHTHSYTHTPEPGHAWAEMELQPEGRKCARRQESDIRPTHLMENFQNKNKYLNLLKQFHCERTARGAEAKAHTHTDRDVYAYAHLRTDTTSRQAWDGAWKRDNGNIQQQYTSKSDKTNIFFLMGFSPGKSHIWNRVENSVDMFIDNKGPQIKDLKYLIR